MRRRRAPHSDVGADHTIAAALAVTPRNAGPKPGDCAPSCHGSGPGGLLTVWGWTAA